MTAWPALLVTATLAVVGGVGLAAGHPLLVTSFSSSAVLMFTLPDSPAARPRAVIGGHALSAAAGLLVASLLAGPEVVVFSLTAGLACASMLATGCLHPPATTTALVAAFTDPSAAFLVVPVLIGAVCLVGAAECVRLAQRSATVARCAGSSAPK